jgi:mannose-6-phosphate isomerase-like protein (cupin superfamily)
MGGQGKNYRHAWIGEPQENPRETLHDTLELTGAEISFNKLPAGASVPFLHSHKLNEEVYIFLGGKGSFQVDGEEFEIGEGSVVRVDPAGKRCIKAAEGEDLRYMCVQAASGSLAQFTMTDGVLHEGEPVWK